MINQDPNHAELNGPEKPVPKGSLLLGLALALLTPLVLVGCFALLRMEFLGVVLVVIGLSQLAYIIPLGIYFGVKKMRRTLQGLLIGAGVIFLLNAACFGLVMSTFKMH